MAKSQNLDLNALIPSALKNDTLTSLVSNLFNRFVSEEHSVSINGRVGRSIEGDADIQAPTLNRKLNALIPALYFKTGTVESVYTFDDLLNKLEVLGTDTINMRKWMAEQTFNYSLPIDYDKFINYASYYWVGKQRPSSAQHVWNLETDPEFYTIARPEPTDPVKVPVALATTWPMVRTIGNREAETFTITFTSTSTFEVTSDLGTVTANTYTVSETSGDTTPIQLVKGPTDLDPGAALISCVITTGYRPFSAGDSFTVNITYFTSEIYVTLNTLQLNGKGTLTAVVADLVHTYVDDVRLKGGERILVKDQQNPAENGIFVVTTGGSWIRAVDADDPLELPVGTQVYVEGGTQNAGHTFSITSIGNGVDPVVLDTANGEMVFTLLSTTMANPINEWQELNHWVHKSDFATPAFANLDFGTAIQATRPIIEYSDKLQLNSSYDANGTPDDASPGMYTQRKTRMNQLPQFDLFRYDGTHHGSTSGLFFYVEDPDFTTDSVLLKRVKTTADYDYVFGIGNVDADGRLLYYKERGELKGTWRAGVAAPTVSSPQFDGGEDRGSISVHSLNPHADNQQWTATAISATEFSVIGTRTGDAGIATVGTTFTAPDDFSIDFTVGAQAYTPGDVFTFAVLAPISPRYVKELADESIINYPGWVSGDATDAVIDGTWLTPARMFQNLERETRTEIAFADLMNHARSVMRHQDDFQGTSFGINNTRDIPFDSGRGGTIREFSSNFPLLASMLIEQDVSPLTIIDFAEQQYMTALASIDQFLADELANYLTSSSSLVSTVIDPNTDEVQLLLSKFEALRATNTNLRDVFSDTTAKVANWPATLPMFGMSPAVVPRVEFDPILGIDVIVHHDGHVSPLGRRDATADRALVQSVVLRSDGTSSSGVFSESAPSLPYARQLWLKPSTFELKHFDVVADSVDEPAGVVGGFWFDRSTDTLREWNVPADSWLLTSVTKASRWVTLSTSAVRNSLVLAVENKLYESVHPAMTAKLNLADASASQYAPNELARFASKYNYDIYAPDYNAADAFTWNYSQASIPGVTAGTARWHKIYEAHFDVPGESLPTTRPNLEPWKLLGYATKPAGWDASYKSTAVATSDVRPAPRLISSFNIALFGNNQTIDGLIANNGDRVLVVGQPTTTENGMYIVQPGYWTRAADVLDEGATFVAQEGSSWAGTVWVITSPTPAVGIDPVIIKSIRTWSTDMWTDIKIARPTLKLCVHVHTDALLPPYVAAGEFAASEALLTSIPTGTSSSYTYRQFGPIETVWTKSLEYSYGLARNYFRDSPLYFLDKTWGETYMQVGQNVRVERNLMAPLPSKKFLMHGEKLNNINSYTSAELQQRVTGNISWTNAGLVEFEVTYTADNTTVLYATVNGAIVGMVDEGVPFSFSVDGITMVDVVIDDLGIPFDLGDKITISFSDDVDDPTYVAPVTAAAALGFEGCIADGAILDDGLVPQIQVAPVFSHTAATTKRFVGIGQWFTDLLRFSYIDTDVSNAANAYREWELKLAYRVGSLLRQDSLTIDSTMGKMPTTAYNVVLKKSSQTESKWISALRVQLVQMGSRKLNADGLYIPSNDASDWIFRVEVYNPQHPSAEYYTLDTAGDLVTFNALSKQRTDLAWKKYTTHTSIATATMPQTFVGLQTTLNFIHGYIDRLNDIGWKMNAEDTPITDAETGRNLDWQLEVEKLIDRVYGGLQAGQGHILNPFMEKATLQTPIGLMSRYTESNFIDVYSTQAAFDVTGLNIPLRNLTVIRTDEQTTTRSSTPIFSAHVFIDEYEHAILMNKKFSSEDNARTIFDPFLAARIDTAYLSFTRQDATDGKPTFDGFFLSGNGVARNIVSSIDNIGNYYDAHQTFAEADTSRHALALLGYRSKDYFSDIAITDTTQFNFWRGLIQAKGTNMTIDAFVNYKKFNEGAVDEYWAYKLAEFGDAREKTFPEVKINTSDATQAYTRFQFYSKDDTVDAIPLYTLIEDSDDTRWYSIDDVGKGLKFEAQYVAESVTVTGTTFPQYIRLNNIYHTGDDMSPKVSDPGATIIGASLLRADAAGQYMVTGYTWINPTKLSPIKLFDYQEKTLVDEISLWHPAIGIHAPMPLEIVNVVNNLDPAQYNYTTKTASNVNFRHLKPWAAREVGQVWWDTSNLQYIPYHDAYVYPNRDAREHRWGSLAEWATVDLYEWTESSVHPSSYDALAVAQEGDYEIDESARASGKVGLKKYYSRNRVIKTRPVAWSRAGVAGAVAHPAFGPAEFTAVYAVSNTLIADKGRCAAVNLVSGRNFGAWNITKPVGEWQIGTDLIYNIGSSTQVDIPVVDIQVIASGVISAVSVQAATGGNYGKKIGAIKLLKKTHSDGSIGIRLMDSTGDYQETSISDWYSSDLAADSEKTISFERMGLKVVVERATTGTITASDLASAITADSNDIYVREGVRATEIIPLPDSIFVNDENDPSYSFTEYEWRTWEVPTQAQLTADLVAPRNEWLPYVGDETTVEASASVVALMKATGATLTMKSGITIERFSSSWTDWANLTATKLETVSDGITPVELTLSETIDSNRLSIYANGVQMNPAAYEVDGMAARVVNILPEGTTVFLLYRVYSPTATELAFDPDVKDDLTLQVNYKLDYQYTQVEVRNSEGNITGTKYYFWVQDKTIPHADESMSLSQAKALLKSGPSTYAIFSRMLPTPTVLQPYAAAYDSCAIAGLTALVSKNASYKLRFLRDFTLRDDPEEIKLKNTHAEWALLRKSQASKIPESLWDHLVDAVCGQDAGGNQLPSQTRIDYDARNGTFSKYGFDRGQIFAATDLVRTSIVNAVLNTQLVVRIGSKTFTDYITALDLDESDKWFATPEEARVTMDLIWTTARPRQINEIFFSVLDDALANNYEFSNLFKTSFITVSSTTLVSEADQQEQVDGIY